MKNQLNFIALIFAFALTACNQEQSENFVKKAGNIMMKVGGYDVKVLDPNTPLPEKPTIPNFPTDEEVQNKIKENQEYINRKIVKKDGKTIYYFQEAKQKNDKTIYTLTDDKNQAKYYRVILGKTAENYCAVQDFYANGEKRREQYIIMDTDCTQFSNSLTTNPIRDYLTLVWYRPQEKIQYVDIVDIQNKTRNIYTYSDKEKNTSPSIISDDFNLNKRQFFWFDMNNENPDIYIFIFNEQQLIEKTTIYSRPDFNNYTLAERSTNFNFDNFSYDNEQWWKNDEGIRTVVQSHFKGEEYRKQFAEPYQSIMKSKKLIDR